MKKKVIILMIIILFVTGCTCEYNLDIENGNYKENITLKADTDEELKEFNKNWKVPTDKEEYNIGEKIGTTPTYQSELYDYKLSNNVLTFSHTFDINSIVNSSAVSNCYDLLTVKEYESTIIISTSSKLRCFDSYPEMNRIIVIIGVDKKVISNNADSINGNKYIWYLDKSEKDKKSINMTIDNTIEDAPIIEPNNSSQNQNNNSNNQGQNSPDYTLYIFCGILLIVMLTAYFIFNKIKKKNDEMDD